MASDSAAAELLEAFPLPCLIVGAQRVIRHANIAAQPYALKLRAHWPDALDEAVGRAIQEERRTKLPGELFTGIGTLAHGFVSPWQGEALIVLEPAGEVGNDFTALSSTMAAMLAHEIRNPLLSIKGAAQLLQASVVADDQPMASLIIDEVGRIDQLIGTLDPLAAAPAHVKEKLNVHELLGHAQLAVKAAHPRPVMFEIAYDPSLPEVMGQRDALVQALVNLMKNAAEAVEMVAMPRITLSTRFVLGETRRNAAGARLPIAISITDNGRGVPPAFVPQLFAPFATTKTTGRGLGLAVVARIAEEHGGVAVHESAEHGGARFTLYLPIAEHGATPPA